jgi:hypothetical protein
MTRNGKIARVPGTIRAQLNSRMDKGEEGESLLAWLNGLPVVQEILKDSFEGTPISKQNLSEWRQGGFREWQVRQEWIGQARELSESAGEMEEAVDASLLACDLAAVLAGRYAALLNNWDGEPDPKFEEKLRLLRGLNRDIALLQRTLQRASEQQKELEQESEDRERREFEESKKRTLDLLWSVPKTEALARVIGGGKLGRKLAELIMAVKHDLPLPTAKEEGRRGKASGQIKGARWHQGKDSQGQSNPVKPGQTNSQGRCL